MKTMTLITIKNLGRLSMGLAALALASACAKTAPTLTHSAPIDVEPVVHAPKGPTDPERLAQLDTASLTRRLGGNGFEPSSVNVSEAESILKELEDVMLVGSYIENPRYAASGQLRRALQVWNLALFGSLRSGRTLTDKSGADLLSSYARVILSGCNEDLQGCVNIGFFQRDPLSARIIEELAKRKESAIQNAPDRAAKMAAVRDYYKYLLVAYDLRNRTASPEFEFLYLNRASEYAEYFKEASEATKDIREAGQAARVRAALRRHAEIFEMVLNGFNPNVQDPQFRARFERFVNEFKPWHFSRREANPFGVGATKMLGLAASNFMYGGSAQGGLSQSFQKAIQDSQALASDENDERCQQPKDRNFSEIFRCLTKAEPGIVRNLDLTDGFPKDEYFFIIDRMFRDHLTPDDTSAIWSGTRKDSARLLKTLELYLKVELAWMIVRTNRFMGGVYGNREGYTGNSLLKHAIESSYGLSNEWISMVSKIERIGIFVNRHMRNAQSGVQTPEFDRIDKLLTNLGRNIKFVSVYPNMMLMLYFMEVVEGKLTIYTWFGPIELDTNIVINAFLEGYLAPFFRFGNDGQRLSKYEIVYSFYFALKTGTFNTFQAGLPSAGANQKPLEEKFFETVIGKYLADEEKALTEDADKLRDTFEQSPNYANYLRVCEQDKRLLATGSSAGPQAAALSMDLNDFISSTYMGSSRTIGSTAIDFYSKFLAAGNGTDIRKGPLKSLADGLRPKFAAVESMLQIYEKHLTDNGVAECDRKAKLDKIRGNFDAIKIARARLLTELLRRHREVLPCMTQSAKIEWDRQYLLIKKEEAHLRDAWRRMQKARNPQAPVAGGEAVRPLEELFKDYRVLMAGDPLPENFLADGSIDKNSYNYSQIDVLLRLRRFMKELAPNVSIRLPNELFTNDLWKKPSRTSLSADLTEDQFVQQGLLMLNGTAGQPFVKWLADTNEIDPYVMAMQLPLELYRQGEFEVLDLNDANCREGGDIKKCRRIATSYRVEDAVNEITSLIRFLSLSNPERARQDSEFLRLLTLQGRFTKKNLEKIFLNEHGVERTLFETLFKNLSEDAIANAEAAGYDLAARTQNHFLFPAGDEVNTAMLRNYCPMVANWFGRAEAFVEAVNKKAADDKRDGKVLSFGYEFRNGHLESIDVPEEGGVPVYLNRVKVDEFKTVKRKLQSEAFVLFDSCRRLTPVPQSTTCEAGAATARGGSGQ